MDSEIQQISALLNAAKISRRDKNLIDAKRSIVSAIKIARRISHNSLLARALNDLAGTDRDLGNKAASIETYEELAELQKKNNNKLGTAHALRHLADICQEERFFEKAENQYIKAIQIYQNHRPRSSLNLANALRGYALLKIQLKQDKLSLPLWKEAKKLYEVNKIELGVKECDQWIKKIGTS